MGVRRVIGDPVRYRFAVLDLAEGWIELEPGPAWKLAHAERKDVLRVSVFPVAEGLTMDLATLRVLAHQKQGAQQEIQRHAPRRFQRRVLLLDEDSWSVGEVFCVTTSLRSEMAEDVGYQRAWTISDGAHMLEATFEVDTEERFRRGVEDCDRMMRGVRFERAS